MFEETFQGGGIDSVEIQVRLFVLLGTRSY